MEKFIREEKGVTAVVAALIMVVLIFFAAIVIDYGNIAEHKRELQNAVDAACLAAAQDLPVSTSDAADTAAGYLEANAPGASVQSVTFEDGNKKISVTASAGVDYSFARAFMGMSSRQITAKATALVTNVFGLCDYALFSGSEIELLQFTGQNYILGDVHSNNNVKNIATIDGTVTAVGTIDGKINAENKVPGYNVLAMPDLSRVVDLSAKVSQSVLLANGATYKDGTYTVSPNKLNALLSNFSHKILYIDGNVTIDGAGVCSTGCLIASGSIKFNGSGVNMGSGDAICLASLGGNIDFNGGGGVFNGILYTPVGGINFNGKIDIIHGSIFGNIIKGNGGLQIYHDSNAENSVPDTEIMLIE